MTKPPIDFDDPRYRRKLDTPECQGLWALMWRRKDPILEAMAAGRGALAALPTEEVLQVCPHPDRAFLTMGGAQMAAFGAYHGYKPEGTQVIYGSPWTRVARFVARRKDAPVTTEPAENSENPDTTDQQLQRLQARVLHLEKVVSRLCERLNLDAPG